MNAGFNSKVFEFEGLSGSKFIRGGSVMGKRIVVSEKFRTFFREDVGDRSW